MFVNLRDFTIQVLTDAEAQECWLMSGGNAQLQSCTRSSLSSPFRLTLLSTYTAFQHSIYWHQAIENLQLYDSSIMEVLNHAVTLRGRNRDRNRIGNFRMDKMGKQFLIMWSKLISSMINSIGSIWPQIQNVGQKISNHSLHHKKKK